MIFDRVKKHLIKKWSSEIVKEVTKNKNIIPGKNLAGHGGQSFTPSYILFQDLISQSRDPNIRHYRHDSLALKETLFYEYFGPFEYWCEQNCQGGFYLWCDLIGINRVFLDPNDETLYRLIFANSMPTMNEIYEFIVDQALET